MSSETDPEWSIPPNAHYVGFAWLLPGQLRCVLFSNCFNITYENVIIHQS